MSDTIVIITVLFNLKLRNKIIIITIEIKDLKFYYNTPYN